MHQIRERLGRSPRRPRWGSLQRSPRPPSWIWLGSRRAPTKIFGRTPPFNTLATALYMYFMHIASLLHHVVYIYNMQLEVLLFLSIRSHLSINTQLHIHSQVGVRVLQHGRNGQSGQSRQSGQTTDRTERRDRTDRTERTDRTYSA